MLAKLRQGKPRHLTSLNSLPLLSIQRPEAIAHDFSIVSVSLELLDLQAHPGPNLEPGAIPIVRKQRKDAGATSIQADISLGMGHFVPWGSHGGHGKGFQHPLLAQGQRFHLVMQTARTIPSCREIDLAAFFTFSPQQLQFTKAYAR